MRPIDFAISLRILITQKGEEGTPAENRSQIGKTDKNQAEGGTKLRKEADIHARVATGPSRVREVYENSAPGLALILKNKTLSAVKPPEG